MALSIGLIIEKMLEWGPYVLKFGKDALDLIKKGWDTNKLNSEIKKQEAFIKNAELNIGARFVEKRMTTTDVAIKDELARISKCYEEIDKYKRALEAIKAIKSGDVADDIKSMKENFDKNKKAKKTTKKTAKKTTTVKSSVKKSAKK